MALHLMCLTAVGGIPIFTRKRGNCENLPFSTVASLNSVGMFCASQGNRLKSTKSKDWSLVWRNFEKVTLIVAGKEFSEKNLNRLLDLISNSFLMFISLEDFRSPSQNFDQMKREAKNYMPIIDKILDSYETDFLNLNDCILISENHQLLSRLNEFSVQLGSLYCSITIKQKLAVATEAWWNLDLIDKKLLITLLNSVNNSTQTDIAVYLPKKSPNTAYRFVTISITSHIILGVICGAEPSYKEINLLTQQIFKNDYDMLQSAERYIPDNFSNFVEIDSNILGIILISKKLEKYVILKNQQQFNSNKSRTDSLMNFLRKFYVEAVDCIDEYLNVKKNNEDEKAADTIALEQYWCSDSYKCYSYQDDDGNLICAGYDKSVQNYTMGLITKKTLSIILQHNSICW